MFEERKYDKSAQLHNRGGLMSIQEAVCIWGISRRRISKLCEEGRIAGAEKHAGVWGIPIDAQRPEDLRKKASKGSVV